MFKKTICFILLTQSVYAAPETAHFALKMENLLDHNIYISFEPGIGKVFFDIPLEDNTLIKAHETSNIYGVNFASNDPSSTFNIRFNDNVGECIFTVGYFTPPLETPVVSFTGNRCESAGYRMDNSGYETLFLYM